MARQKKVVLRCAVGWCVCLARKGSPYCAVHAVRGKDFKVQALPADVEAGECDNCDGSGECDVCEGDGEHCCEHERCNESHFCGACQGTGKCQTCLKKPAGVVGFDATYLAWAFDTGWHPPVLITNPWEEAA